MVWKLVDSKHYIPIELVGGVAVLIYYKGAISVRIKVIHTKSMDKGEKGNR